MADAIGAADVFALLGGEIAAVDLWTRVDFGWMHPGADATRDVVGYRGLPMSCRVAGLTLGDADVAPPGPPFLITIGTACLTAQLCMSGGAMRDADLHSADLGLMKRWTAGSLTRNLRVVRFPDGDVGLEAELHFSPLTPQNALREFVTAFSWDVAAFHAAKSAVALSPTEEWMRRAAVSISRSTPHIPLRAHQRVPDWPVAESPRGVFCALQPGGGLAISDNVLYAVRQDVGALAVIGSMPGQPDEWDCQRLTDVWLTRDGSRCLARSLMCEGFLKAGDGPWSRIDTDSVTAVAPWGDGGFLLGHYDGQLDVLDSDRSITARRTLGRATGRFSSLVSAGDRAIGIVGSHLLSARIPLGLASGVDMGTEPWSISLTPLVRREYVCTLDVDAWSAEPIVAVLGDDGILIISASTGALRARFETSGVRLAHWIGAGRLLVIEAAEDVPGTRPQLRVLDISTGEWTNAIDAADITRLAVRGDEIHVGYADQSIGVWDRIDIARRVGLETGGAARA